jgi:hypothetical protein
MESQGYEDAVTVQVLRPYVIEVTFADGTCRRIDLEPELEEGLMRELRNPDLFRQVTVEYGALEWPNGVGLAPEWVYCAGELSEAAA